MLKKNIKYPGFDGNEYEEDFYFNLTKTEISQKQLSVAGGLVSKLERISKSQDVPEIAKLFQDFIDMSYGKKSDDGKHFIKSKEILDDFKSTNAYDVLYMELISDVKKAIEFINGILPRDMAEKAMSDPEVLAKLKELEQ